MLKQLIANENKIPVICDYEPQIVGPGQVRIKSLYGAPKHGTELTINFHGSSFLTHNYDAKQYLFVERTENIPAGISKLGNMWVGEITELAPGVSGFNTGEIVAAYGHLAQDHVIDAASLLKVPDGLDWKTIVCYDPLQFAIGGLRDANMRIGDVVLVTGLGAIGQMAAQSAVLAGASQVFVSDPIELRRKVALENGAHKAFDPTKGDMGLEIRDLTEKRGVDIVIETSADYKAIEQGLRALAYRGTMALVGWFKECKVPFTLGDEGHFNSQNIVLSRAESDPNRDYPNWSFARIRNESWRLLCSGAIRCENIVYPVVPFDECDKAYKKYILDHPEESVKLGVTF